MENSTNPSLIVDFQQLEQVARSSPPVTVAVAGAADEDVLVGALRAVREGVARALLVGEKARIEEVAGKLHAEGELAKGTFEIVHAEGDAAIAAKSVELAASGKANLLLKGMVATGTLMRAALAREGGLRESETLLSDVLVCPNPFRAGRPFVAISDGGLNVLPDLTQKKQILKNALSVVRALGVDEPRVAVLCASEKADKAMPHTLDAKAIAESAAAGEFGACLVEGPLSFDVAVSAEAAEHKGVASRVAGRPDLLLAPTVEAGNLFAKTLYLAARLPVAHVIVGARVPILINSRNDSGEDRYRSILLALVVANRRQQGAREKAAAVAPKERPAARILALNPGSTSTKVALYEGLKEVWREDIAHDDAAFKAAPSVFAQLESRLQAIRGLVRRHGMELAPSAGVAGVVGRGGLLPPLPGGTYKVNAAMVEDLKAAKRGEHASNLGAPLARALADAFGCEAFIVDPVAVDEMRDDARLTGWPGLQRESLSHALNLRAVARRVAARLGEPLSRLRLIGIHLGSGISMAAFERGRMIDIVNPRDEGPISVDRAGALPANGLAKLVVSESWTVRDCEKRLGREAGAAALLGTRDMREVRRRADAGDAACKALLDAMALGIGKWAFGLMASLNGLPDRFYVTGGMARDQELVGLLRATLERVADVVVVPGEDEIAALVEGTLCALSGEEPAAAYPPARPRAA
jgi:butyrate kinase